MTVSMARSNQEPEKLVWIDDFRMVFGGQKMPCLFYNRIREMQFFTLPDVNDNEIVRSTFDRVEGKSGLFCLVRYSKLLVPTCFAISGYPWQKVETKWRWLATQDHSKLVHRVINARLKRAWTSDHALFFVWWRQNFFTVSTLKKKTKVAYLIMRSAWARFELPTPDRKPLIFQPGHEEVDYFA